MSRELFGTDGIRAEANVYPMTGEVAMKVGRALVYTLLHQADVWRSHGHYHGGQSTEQKKIKIVIGKDTRRSGYMIETALASGVCSMGGEAILLGPLPTPGVAFVATSMRADAGIMISASHNPYHDNGIKIFGANGFKAPDAIEESIERLVLDSAMMDVATKRGPDIGRAHRIEEAHGRYIVFLKSAFPAEYDLSGVKLALDCANGAAYKAAPMAFEELGASVVTMGVEPNGVNINAEVGALFPQKMAELTRKTKSHIGIALDGDADRLIVADEKGRVIDGDVVMAICGIDMLERKQLAKKTLVATVMSNLGLDRAIEKAGGKVVRTGVGDRYVVEAMRKHGYVFGGEQSGHLIFLEHATTGDGTVAALALLRVMVQQSKRASELARCMEVYPQSQLNMAVREKPALSSLPGVTKAIADAEKKLGKDGRVLVRYSGTEAKVRVLVEGPEKKRIDGFAQAIGAELKKAIGA